ncbi:MAG: class I SAM-dependent methyltransferase [Alphaproteobacteria bacterium]|nr:class I SAM-dependent methyltransferase [Alphaproteobacteria bacterium]
MENFQAIYNKHQNIYDKHAARFDGERPKMLIERKWLDRFISFIDSHEYILDIGCGAGEPVARYFIDQGYRVTGLDFSKSMIDICKSRFPDHDWHIGDMIDFDLGKKYKGIVAWHSFFHLPLDDQRRALECFAKHLSANGVLMLTVGPENSEVLGNVCGEQVYHASFNPEEYEEILSQYGIEILEFVPEDPDCFGSTILLARKTS